MRKYLHMMIEAWFYLFRFRWVAGKDIVATDDPALHFVQPDHAPKLRCSRDLPFADDRRVRFEQAHKFLLGRNRSEEHTSELQSREYLVCRLLLEKKKRTLR